MPLILLQTAPPANLAYLFAAFAVCWIVFFAYAFFLTRRRRELEQEWAELEVEGVAGEGAEGGGG